MSSSPAPSDRDTHVAACPYCGEPKARHEYASPGSCVIGSTLGTSDADIRFLTGQRTAPEKPDRPSSAAQDRLQASSRTQRIRDAAERHARGAAFRRRRGGSADTKRRKGGGVMATVTRHERDYIERTIATVRNHRDADNCWPQWANIFADEIERLWAEGDTQTAALRLAADTIRGLADQQAMPDNFYRATLTRIEETLSD